MRVHGLEADPFFAEDCDAADRLVAESAGAELFLYPGDQRLCAPTPPEAAAPLNRRALDFLAGHGEPGLRSR
ncbi:hypothetical protein EES44_17630 [Streptomyces sp. ADI96-15]|uniref:hypothetical protein n=1 Tax=Streptomyces TaxID=1883 RepID=UPI000FBDB862|nr:MULTISPECIES: hypothetical protein [unclassified Streptomyces]RPK62257.1 hypothetical protein EES44_17630 [Streptomyces sp. ADI96-15]